MRVLSAHASMPVVSGIDRHSCNGRHARVVPSLHACGDTACEDSDFYLEQVSMCSAKHAKRVLPVNYSTPTLQYGGQLPRNGVPRRPARSDPCETNEYKDKHVT